MKIQLLGTAASEGIPALFCKCEICLEAKRRGSRDIRARSSALINDTMLIDITPDTLTQCNKFNIDSTKWNTLLLTHSHTDHCHVGELQYLLPPFITENKQKLTVVSSKTLKEQAHQQYPDLKELEWLVIEPFTTITLQKCDITALPSNHIPDEPSLNYIINDGSASLLYACDTGWYDEPVWDYLKQRKLDAVILEATDGFAESNWEGHLNIAKAIAMKYRLNEISAVRKNGLCIATHFAHTGRALHVELEAEFAAYGIVPGFDGMITYI